MLNLCDQQRLTPSCTFMQADQSHHCLHTPFRNSEDVQAHKHKALVRLHRFTDLSVFLLFADISGYLKVGVNPNY